MSDHDEKSAGKVAENSNPTEKSSTEKPSNVTPLRPTRPCPECGKTSHRDSYPFCSPRCRSVDLNRWLSDAYVIPGRLTDDEDEPQD